MNRFLDNRKISTNVSSDLRRRVWEMYAGPNVRTLNCLCCGKALSRNVTADWEAAHIVAQKFHTRKPTKYDLVPTCRACNNECQDYCLFDFLYARDRLHNIKTIVKQIYVNFAEEHPDIYRDRCKSTAYKVIKMLFTGKEFKAGGGLTMQRQIFELCNVVQLEEERERMAELTQKMNESIDIIERCTKRVKLSKEGINLI